MQCYGRSLSNTFDRCMKYLVCPWYSLHAPWFVPLKLYFMKEQTTTGCVWIMILLGQLTKSQTRRVFSGFCPHGIAMLCEFPCLLPLTGSRYVVSVVFIGSGVNLSVSGYHTLHVCDICFWRDSKLYWISQLHVRVELYKSFLPDLVTNDELTGNCILPQIVLCFCLGGRSTYYCSYNLEFCQTTAYWNLG